MDNFTERGIAVVEGPQFSGKSTEIASLSKMFSGQLVVVPESCDWVGGNKNFPSMNFSSLEDAKKSTHFFLELERRRCDFALEMREKTGLPVVMDRVSTYSSLVLYKLMEQKFSERFKFGGILEQGVESFQQALEDGKIFLPDRMVLMVPADEETFLSRLNRGGSLGSINQWENIETIIKTYREIAQKKYPSNFMQIDSRNNDPDKEYIAIQLMKFLTAELDETPKVDLYTLFELKRPDKLRDDESNVYIESRQKVGELVAKAKTEYRKLDEGVVIRPGCDQNDADAFKKVVLEVLDHEWGFKYNPEFSYDLDHPFEVYGKGEGKFFVLESGGKVVGTAAVEDQGNGVAYWRRLMILPEYRQKGWGVDLNRMVYDYSKASGFKVAHFDTLKNTGMWKKYVEKWGCKIVKEEPEGDNTKVFLELDLNQPLPE